MPDLCFDDLCFERKICVCNSGFVFWLNWILKNSDLRFEKRICFCFGFKANPPFEKQICVLKSKFDLSQTLFVFLDLCFGLERPEFGFVFSKKDLRLQKRICVLLIGALRIRIHVLKDRFML